MAEITLETILQAVQQLGGRMDRLDGRLDRFQAEQGRMGDEIMRVRVDIMARIDRLQDDVSTVKEGTFVSFARAERAERTAKDEVRSLAEELSVVHRQIHRLQEEVRSLRGDQ